MKARLSFTVLFLCLFLLAGCVSEKDTEKNVGKDGTQAVAQKESEDMPSFVKEADFDQIDWNKVVTKIGTDGVSDIVGNSNKVGYIGSELQAKKVDKWLWHFFGKSQGSLTVVAYHQETSTKVPILTRGYTTEVAAGAMNGADATMPSNVSLPKSGKWALLVYIDEELFDTLVINVKEK
ncbi:MAG: DUF4871 domain-containing protein [Bacillus sp. (in: firmicutes)]